MYLSTYSKLQEYSFLYKSSLNAQLCPLPTSNYGTTNNNNFQWLWSPEKLVLKISKVLLTDLSVIGVCYATLLI